MSVVDPTTLSSEERPVGMTTRADLVVQESIYQGERCWIIKDPLAMKYFRLMGPEYQVFTALRQHCSYHDIKTGLDRAYPETINRMESVQQLVVSMHRSGLLKSNSGGQAKPLQKRRNKELKQKSFQLLSSIVSLRFPGFDPEWLLVAMYRRIGFVFSTWFTCIVWITAIAAGGLVLGNLNEFLAKLPDFQSFFAFDNLLFLGGILIFTKTIHEFGHGLMCHHYGGECHEIGFMLMVLTPAMYCDTSDSWILPNRWHRMAIGAAGMYVEVFMAAICTFIWWFTNPGWLHYLCLNIMFLSSVSTILFNANPLLRYDGYYILSDFLEIPNLSQKSKQSLLSKLRVWGLGMEPVNSRLLPQKNLGMFALYSVSSFFYRWFVIIVIFWFVAEIFEPWGLESLAYIMLAISLFGMVIVPMYKMVKFFLHPGRLREVKRFNLIFSTCLLAVTIGLFCFFPIKQHVFGCCRIRPANAKVVYVQQPGILAETKVQPGDKVNQGDVLAILKNPEFDLELASLKGELARLEHDLTGYELNRNLYLDSARLITQTKLAIDSSKEQLKLKNLQAAPLVLKAPRAGVVVSAPNVPAQPDVGYALKSWSGDPLAPKNIGAFFQPNTMLCMIADEEGYEAIIVMNQADINLIEPGQPTKFCVEQIRDRVFTGEISDSSRDELENVPRELSQSNGGPIAVAPIPGGGEKPLLKSFEVYATISAESTDSLQLGDGFTGSAKTDVGDSTLGMLTLRYLRNLINFR